MPQKLTIITEPFVILCEGVHDSQFFTHVTSEPGCPSFDICSVNYVLGTVHGGNTRFTEALDELPSIPGFEKVTKILIVADNDLDPVVAFDRISADITATAPILGPPASRFVAPAVPLVKAGTNPEIVVLMLPWTGMKGSLSTMCALAARNAAPAMATCVDAFATCTGAGQWSITTLAKMQLRALIASAPMAKPDLSPAYVWSKNTNLVPLSDPVFDQVKGFLRSFPTI